MWVFACCIQGKFLIQVIFPPLYLITVNFPTKEIQKDTEEKKTQNKQQQQKQSPAFHFKLFSFEKCFEMKCSLSSKRKYFSNVTRWQNPLFTKHHVFTHGYFHLVGERNNRTEMVSAAQHSNDNKTRTLGRYQRNSGAYFPSSSAFSATVL